MERAHLLILLLCSCIFESVMPECDPSDLNVQTFDGSCYYVDTSTLSFSESQKRCEDRNMTLASLHSDEDTDFFQSLGIYKSWIGLYEVDGVYTWIDGTPLDYTDWFESQPDDSHSADICVYISHSPSYYGHWLDGSCSSGNSFVCKEVKTTPEATLSPPINGLCPEGTLSEVFSNKCYKVVGADDYNKTSFSRAQTECKSSINNGELASIHTPMELNLIKLLFEGLPASDDIWIGLNSKGNKYTWLDNSTMTYLPWARLHPTSRSDYDGCVAMKRSVEIGSWMTKDCDTKQAFLCQAPKVPGSDNSPDPFATQYGDSSCDSGYFRYHNHCFKYFDDKKTWQDAYDYCKSNSGVLAVTFDDFEVARFIYASMDPQTGKEGSPWIGIKYQPTTAAYVWGDDNNPVTKTFWARGQPQFQTDSHCVYLTADRWAERSCTETHPFICMAGGDRTPPTEAPVDGVCAKPDHLMFGDYCYATSGNKQVTRPAAKTECEIMGMDLLSIHSQEENDFAYQMAKSNTTASEWWIGMDLIELDMAAKRATLSWTDKSAWPWSHFPTGKLVVNPNKVEECGKMDARGYWDIVDCNDFEIGYICKGPKVQPCNNTGWDQHHGFCYYASNYDTRTWRDAHDYCQNKGAELVSIRSSEEQDYIHSLSIAKDGFWLGLYESSKDIYEWTDGSVYNYKHWKDKPPNDHRGEEKCAYLRRKDGLWDDANCGKKYGFVCRELFGNQEAATLSPPVQGTCPDGFINEDFSNKCFYFGGTNGTATRKWHAAHDYCGNVNSKAELASVRDAVEQSFLTLLLEGLPNGNDVWIGLQDKDDKGKFFWVDNSEVDYVNWVNDKPEKADKSNRCVTMIGGGNNIGKWHRSQCNTKNPYVCQVQRVPSNEVSPHPFADQYGAEGCPSDHFRYHDRCYRFVTTEKSYDDAKRDCESKDGGQLALTFDAFELARFTYESIDKDSGKIAKAWIGAKYNKDTGEYVWGDQNNEYWVTKTFWASGQPKIKTNSDSCVSIIDGAWKIEKCSTKLPYFCVIGDLSSLAPEVPTTPAPGVITCKDSSQTAFGGFCYKVYTDEVPREEANDNCEKDGMMLVSIHSKAELEFVHNLAKSTSSEIDYWIGLTANENSKTSFFWMDGSDMNFHPWNDGEPTYKDGNNNGEECVQLKINEDGKWNDINCGYKSSQMGYICKGTAPKPCKNKGWTRLSDDGPCYKYYTSYKTWFDAHDYCQTKEAELVSISSQEEQDFVFSLFKGSGAIAKWIGYTELSVGIYSWTDGTVSSYRNFSENEPNDAFGEEKCVVMNRDTGLWNDNNCNQNFDFICKETVGDKPAATLPPPIQGKCPDNFASEDFSNKCFYVGAANGYSLKKYQDAHDACEAININAELASISSRIEQVFVSLLMETAVGSNNMWIGLNDRSGYSQYVWLDNAEFTYANYDKYEPLSVERNNRCISMQRGPIGSIGKWKQENCDTPNIYLCQTTREPSSDPSPKPFEWQYSMGCDSGFFRYHGICYKFYKDLKSWDDAKAICEKDGYQLAVTFDDFEVARMTYETVDVDKGVAHQAWIGVKYKRTKGEYVWGKNDYELLRSFWERGPSMMTDNTCVSLLDGYWKEAECSEELPFFCVDGDVSRFVPPTPSPSDGSCPDPDHKDFGDYCYMVPVDEKVYGKEALGKCVEKGMELVSIHSVAENDFVYDFAKKVMPDVSWWIGLESVARGEFQWMDGSDITVLPWDTGEPSLDAGTNKKYPEECVEMMKSDGNWNDLNCDDYQLGYICKTPKTKQCKNRGWEPFGNRCYYFSLGARTWFGAHEYCQSKDAELVSITYKAEQQYITQKIHGTGTIGWWTGYNELGDGVYRWTDGSPAFYFNFRDGEPNDFNGAEKCVNMNQNTGLWNDNNCAQDFSFICKERIDKPPATMPPPVKGKCPDSFISEDFSNKCFYKGTTKKTWTSAQQACKKLNKDSVLATINSAVEQSFVELLLENDRKVNYWIGLNDRAGLGKYVWLDNAQQTYENWYKNEPDYVSSADERCIEFLMNYKKVVGEWNRMNCKHKRKYICQVKREESSETSPHPFQDQYDDSKCDNGYFRYHDICYKFVEDSKTWSKAKDYCTNDGGQLAVTFDDFELARFTYESVDMSNGVSKQAWIGLQYKRTTGEYLWGDEYEIKKSFWALDGQTLQTDDTCVSILDGKWREEPCTKELPFFCSKGDTTDQIPTTPNPGAGYCESSDTKPYGDHCYSVSLPGDTVSRNDAIKKCVAQGMDLASIHSISENSFIYSFAQKVNPDTAWWIGLNNHLNKSYTWTDGSDTTLLRWDSGEPSNKGHGKDEECVNMKNSNGKWNDVPCSTKRGYICKVSKTFPCNNTGWTLNNDTCYFANTRSKKSWWDAHEYCQSKGAELASIATEDEQDYIAKMIKGKGTGAWWIGYTEVGAGKYSWTDGTPDSVFNWADKEPNDAHGSEKCVTMNKNNGRWNDDNCEQKFNFICKETTGAPFELPPPVDGICPDGFLAEDFSNRCFYVGGKNDGDKKKFQPAHNACKNLNENAEIASIRNPIEQSFVTLLLETLPENDDMWIGFHDKAGKRSYVWVDNSPVTYIGRFANDPLATSTKLDTCVTMVRSGPKQGQWKTKTCSTENAYICQAPREAKAGANNHPFADQYSDSACSSGYFRYHGRCYKYWKDAKSWDDAKDHCNKYQSNLAVPFDTFEVARFTYESLDKYTAQANQSWIGVRLKRTTGQYLWYDGTLGYEISQPFWGKGEPSMMSDDGCVSVTDGQWFEANCTKELPFFCVSGDLSSYKSTPNPEEGYCENSDHILWRDFCYSVALDDEVTWSNASKNCKDNGMELVSIHSKAENDFVYGLAKKIRPGINWWIGLEGFSTGSFGWSDGSLFTINQWKKGEPNSAREKCVEMMKDDGKWNDVECDKYKLSYICKTSKKDMTSTSTISTTPITASSSTSSTTVSTTTKTGNSGGKNTPATKGDGGGKTSGGDDGVGGGGGGGGNTGGGGAGNSPSKDISKTSQSTGSINGMSGGAVAGIVLTVLLVVALAAVAAFLTVTKRWSVVIEKVPMLRSKATTPAPSFENRAYDGNNMGIDA